MALSKIDTGGLAADAVDNTILDLADDFAGMHFGGTGNANQLDDYENGTWTATLQGSTTNPTTAVTITGSYTKVGAIVTAHGTFGNVSTVGASGGVRIAGLPFTASGTQACGNVMTHTRYSLDSNARNISPYIGGFGTTISFYQSRNTSGWSEITHSAGSSAGYLYFSVTYRTAQ